MKTLQEKFLFNFLKELPSFQALFRSAEAVVMFEKNFKEPILDVGCGDGIFAQIFFWKKNYCWIRS